MTIRICAKPFNITVIQVYAAATELEIESFYAMVQETLKSVSKKDIVYILGDFNAKVMAMQIVLVIR